jgi:hypothetical protein
MRRYMIELDDVEGHMGSMPGGDLLDKSVTVRFGDGTEVQGHLRRFTENMTGEDRLEADATDDDVEGHGPLRPERLIP